MQGKQEGGGPQGCLSALPAPGQGEMGQQKIFWEKWQTSIQHCRRQRGILGEWGLDLRAVRLEGRTPFIGYPFWVFTLSQLVGIQQQMEVASPLPSSRAQARRGSIRAFSSACIEASLPCGGELDPLDWEGMAQFLIALWMWGRSASRGI